MIGLDLGGGVAFFDNLSDHDLLEAALGRYAFVGEHLAAGADGAADRQHALAAHLAAAGEQPFEIDAEKIGIALRAGLGKAARSVFVRGVGRLRYAESARRFVGAFDAGRFARLAQAGGHSVRGIGHFASSRICHGYASCKTYLCKLH